MIPIYLNQNNRGVLNPKGHEKYKNFAFLETKGSQTIFQISCTLFSS